MCIQYFNGIILKIYNFIISRKLINKNNRICRRVRAALFHNICYRCSARMGNRNPDRTFYVIRCPQENMGLFAVINYIVYHLKIAERSGFEPVIDWKYYPNKYFTSDENVGKRSIWEDFFVQPADVDIEEVYKSRHVEMSAGDWEASALKELKGGPDLADSHRVYTKYIVLNDKMRGLVDRESERIGFNENKVLAVKIRGTDFVTAKPKDHANVRSAADTAAVVEEKLSEWGPFDRIYLATEDTQALDFMKEKYSEKLYYTEAKTYETSDVGKQWLSELYDKGNIDKIADMESYLITTYMLARADYLIAPAVGGTLGALRIKGDYKEYCIVR